MFTDGCNHSKDNKNENERIDGYINNSANVSSEQTKIENMDRYNISNKYTGIALIFNHIKIMGEEDRTGTEIDLERICTAFKNYGFDVRPYTDQKHQKIKNILKAVAKEDHSDHDCLAVVVMSHGQPGRVFAKDVPYLIQTLWEPFLGDKCKSLIDKPKLFFIQSCRGYTSEKGVFYRYNSQSGATASTEFDALGSPVTYSIPTTADILVNFSTFESQYSCRDTKNGTWFIQSLANVLDASANNLNGTELYSMLLRVARIVAYKYELHNPEDPEKHKTKQMPAILSTLTKIFTLTKKKPKNSI